MLRREVENKESTRKKNMGDSKEIGEKQENQEWKLGTWTKKEGKNGKD